MPRPIVQTGVLRNRLVKRRGSARMKYWGRFVGDSERELMTVFVGMVIEWMDVSGLDVSTSSHGCVDRICLSVI